MDKGSMDAADFAGPATAGADAVDAGLAAAGLIGSGTLAAETLGAGGVAGGFSRVEIWVTLHRRRGSSCKQ